MVSDRVWRTAGSDHGRRGLFTAAVAISRRTTHRLKACGAVQASAVFTADGTVFVADLAGHVQAFSSAGRKLWDTPLDGGVSATPALALDETFLYAGTHAGTVYALGAADGKVAWRTAVPTKSDPRILSDLLYQAASDRVVLSSWGGRFVALDARSGVEAASWDAGISPGAAATADAAGNLYCLRAVASRGIEFLRVCPAGAETVLHREPETSRGARRALVAAAPVLDESRGQAYFILNADKTASLVAWSLAEGRIRWREGIGVGVQGTPAVRADGAVIVADLGGEVHGFSAGGWRLFTCYTDGDYFLAGPVVEAGGRVLLGDPLGRLHLVESDGRRRVLCEVPRAIQARASFDPTGNLYLPVTDKSVYVLRGRATAA